MTPANSRLVRLKDVVSPRKIKIQPGDFAGRDYLGLEHIESHLGRISRLDSSDNYRSAANLAEEGDVLFGRLRPYLNKVVISPSQLLTSGELIVLPPSDDIEAGFLKHLLMTPRFLGFTALLDTGDRPRVSWDGIGGFRFSLPGVDEQRRIVAELEEQLGHLEATRKRLKETNVQLEEVRSSALHRYFGSGTQRMSWRTKPLGELAQTQLGKMLNSSKQTGEFSRRYLRNINVQWGYFDMADIKSMDILPAEEAKFLAHKGDLLVCEGGEVGRAAIWEDDEPIAIQNALHRVQANSELEGTYLRYYLEHLAKAGVLERYASGVTIKHLPQEKLRRVAISYPPVDQQLRIVSELEEQLGHLEATRATLEETESQLEELRASLLHRAFSDPEEEL